MNNRRSVMLENYSDSEGDCTCGCGMQVDGRHMVRQQAFIYYLEAVYGCEIRHRVTSGARCKSKNNAIRGHASYSQHLDGLATDGHYDRWDGLKWVEIPSADIAKHAINSKLFTGVGWKKYKAEGAELNHLDSRPGKRIATW